MRGLWFMEWADGPACVRVPATSANLGPGFDALGLALSLHDEVEARITGAGLDIEVSGEGAADVADAGEKHLIVRAMRVAFDELGLPQPPGLALRCVNRIPHGRGLGSSAAAIVAGLVAARALAGASLSPEDVLPLANFLEGHPDNVAPCLFGGLTIAWVTDEESGLTTPTAGHVLGAAGAVPGRSPGEGAATGRVEGLPPTRESDQGGKRTGTGTTEDVLGATGAVPGLRPGEGVMGEGLPHAWGGHRGGHPPGGSTARAIRLEPRPEVLPVAFIAPEPVSTKVARGLLPSAVPHGDASRNAGRAALLVAALTARDLVNPLGALFDGTEDKLHQHYRAPAMPHSYGLVTRLRAVGVPAVISGAGPTVLAFLTEKPDQDDVKRLDSIAAETGIDWHISPLAVERRGVSVIPSVPTAR